MRHSSRNRSISKSLRIAPVVALVILGVYDAMLLQAVLACPGPTGPTYSGTEAYASTITLQMPFIAGETWTVGGDGSFYGNNEHCNNPNNDYYATDWNRTNDDGASVLPVADGVVSDIEAPPCPEGGFGCYVQIDHANGYRTVYAHLSDVLVAQDETAHTWTLIGRVGDTGLPVGEGSHLHLTFRHDDGGYFSYCWNNGQTCPNGETPQWPQGHRPSPMMTASGPTILEDFQSYTSVNGRIYLPDLRNNDNGWTTEFYVRNDGTESRFVTIRYFNENGTPTPRVFDRHVLSPNQWRWIPVNEFNRIPAGTTGSAYIDGGEAVSVVVTQRRASPEARAAYLGVSQPSTQVHVPLLHKNNYGLYSELYIQNNWPTATDVTVQFKVSPGQSGSNCTQTFPNVPARGLKVIRLSEVGCIGATFVGSAYVTNSANHALAVASTQRKSDQSNMAESSGAGGTANTAYAPLIQNNNYGWISGIALQNASGSTNNLTANVYNQTGGWPPCRTDTYSNIGARRSQIISTLGVFCTSVASAVYGGGSQPVAAIVNQVLPGTPSSSDYEAITAPSKKVVVPLWRNQSSWISGLVVQNVNDQWANITITFYTDAGNPSGSPLTAGIPPRALYIRSSTGVTSGSAVVTADLPVAVVVNHFLNISGDRSMSHIGVQR